MKGTDGKTSNQGWRLATVSGAVISLQWSDKSNRKVQENYRTPNKTHSSEQRMEWFSLCCAEVLHSRLLFCSLTEAQWICDGARLKFLTHCHLASVFSKAEECCWVDSNFVPCGTIKCANSRKYIYMNMDDNSFNCFSWRHAFSEQLRSLERAELAEWRFWPLSLFSFWQSYLRRKEESSKGPKLFFRRVFKDEQINDWSFCPAKPGAPLSVNFPPQNTFVWTTTSTCFLYLLNSFSKASPGCFSTLLAFSSWWYCLTHGNKVHKGALLKVCPRTGSEWQWIGLQTAWKRLIEGQMVLNVGEMLDLKESRRGKTAGWTAISCNFQRKISEVCCSWRPVSSKQYPKLPFVRKKSRAKSFQIKKDRSFLKAKNEENFLGQ